VTARRTPLTLEEHRQLGLALAGIDRQLGQIWVWLGNERLPKNHAAVRRMQTVRKRLGDARSDLENVMFGGPHGSEPGATTRVYYPHREDREARTDQRQASLSYRAVAEREWPEHVWITGNGPYATVSYCAGYDPPPEPGEPVISVMLHATEDLARQALDLIDRISCGGGCTRRHGLYLLAADGAREWRGPDGEQILADGTVHGPLDHDVCCYLPQGCEGGCTQPGGCMDPDPATYDPDPCPEAYR
jgi:hypothetical protein